MKKLILLLIVFVSILTSAQNTKPEKFSGVITYDNGELIEFNWLNSSYGSEIPFSSILQDLNGSKNHLQRIILTGVEEIEFLEFTQEEKEEINSNRKYPGYGYSIRKANVIFNDNSTLQNVFLDCRSWIWKKIIPEDVGRITPITAEIDTDKLVRISIKYNDNK